MAELEILSLLKLEPENEPPLPRNRVQKWADWIGYSALFLLIGFSLFYRLPRLVLLLFAPTVLPFLPVVTYHVAQLNQRASRIALVEAAALHTVVLLAGLTLWTMNPNIERRVDFPVVYALLLVVAEIGGLLLSRKLRHFRTEER